MNYYKVTCTIEITTEAYEWDEHLKKQKELING